MSIYMQIKGISGSSSDSNHQGWIELTGFNQKVKRSVSGSVGRMQDRETGIPVVGEFEIIKVCDKSSAALY